LNTKKLANPTQILQNILNSEAQQSNKFILMQDRNDEPQVALVPEKEPDYIRYHKQNLDLTYCKDFSQMDRQDGLNFKKRGSERSPQRYAKFAKEFDQSLGIAGGASPKNQNQDIVNVISGGDKRVKGRTAAP